MRKGWEYKKLRFDEVFDLQMGKTPDRKNFSLFEGDNTWVSISDLGDKYISTSKECISDEAAANIKMVKKGTVIMSFKLTVGKCGIAAKGLYTNEAIMAFNLKPEYDIGSDFLYYYLQGYKWAGANKAVMGVTLNKATISKHHIEIPPKSTQQAIVSELDKINELIRLKKEQLKDYDNLAQSIFYEMFGDPVTNEKGWEVKKLGDVGDIIAGGTPSTNDPDNWDGNINWVTPAELGSDFYYGETVRKITDKGARGLTLMPVGTVLLSSRAPIGKLAITTEPMCCNQGFKNVLCGDYLNNIYVYYFLKTTMENIQALGVGATFKEVSKKAISSYKLILPPLPLQQTFATRIEAIERQKAEVQKAITELETLLASRMQYWFE